MLNPAVLVDKSASLTHMSDGALSNILKMSNVAFEDTALSGYAHNKIPEPSRFEGMLVNLDLSKLKGAVVQSPEQSTGAATTGFNNKLASNGKGFGGIG